jgi:hypothetical protein
MHGVLASLTTFLGVGIFANTMNATLIVRSKTVTAEGDIIEFVVWRVPVPVPPSRHDFKYRAAYVVEGKRVVGFDNERGKGDHKHVMGHETVYRFTSVEQMIEDFISEVDAIRRQR